MALALPFNFSDFLRWGASCLAESPTFFEIICIASGATLLEQFAFLGLDNLTVPLSVAWLWSQLI